MNCPGAAPNSWETATGTPASPWQARCCTSLTSPKTPGIRACCCTRFTIDLMAGIGWRPGRKFPTERVRCGETIIYASSLCCCCVKQKWNVIRCSSLQNPDPRVVIVSKWPLTALMPEPIKLVRIPTLKTVADFRNHVASLAIELPCEDHIAVGPASPLAQPVEGIPINGKKIGNRFAIQPMEGWDGTSSGGVTDEVVRRWQRFGESGAKLIYGGEAMAVRPDGRANPNQLIITDENKSGLARIREVLIAAHQQRYGATADLVIGFQLTHS